MDGSAGASDHTRELTALARSIAEERYAPRAAQWDLARETFPREERAYLGSLGLLGICLPERFGGSGAPLKDALVVIEELAKVCRPAAFQVFEANTGPARVLALLGSEDLQARYLPQIVTGEATMAVAISEPDAGSAATDMLTRAKLANGSYTVNGVKRWISNGSEADYYFLYTRLTDEPGSRGIGAIVVEADRPGVSYGTREKLMGFRGIPSADIIFDDVVVPEANLVLPAGQFRTLFRGFSIERLHRDAHGWAIAGGTPTMQRVRIVSELLGRTFDQRR